MTNFEKYLLELSGTESLKKTEVIQSLWSGYGEIARYKLADSNTVVVKCISLGQSGDHPRGWNTDKSHSRKVKSYQVETEWYKNWSDNCDQNCRVPKFMGAFKEGEEQWIVLEDLDSQYPGRRSSATFSEVKVCLKWLANFHGTFIGVHPVGLWEIGTYWHLDTRPDEWDKIENQDLKSKAKLIDEALNNCQFKTIVHGDAKLANFCFSEDGKNVAAVDFQYVGGGCGMKDVAYLLGSCLSSEECELFETELLNFYFAALKESIESDINFEQLEAEWRRLYPIAWTDFTRFLMGWMPTHQKLNGYSLKLMNQVLAEL